MPASVTAGSEFGQGCGVVLDFSTGQHLCFDSTAGVRVRQVSAHCVLATEANMAVRAKILATYPNILIQ